MAVKTFRQLERYFKGASNHYRIGILVLLDKHKSLSLGQISELLKGNEKTMSEHTHRLVKAGLVNKRQSAQNVLHVLSPYGQRFVRFIKTFNQ